MRVNRRQGGHSSTALIILRKVKNSKSVVSIATLATFVACRVSRKGSPNTWVPLHGESVGEGAEGVCRGML